MQFVDRWLPLIVCVREGGPETDEVEQLGAGFDRYFRRGEPYAVLNVARLRARAPDARGRRNLAEWANQPHVRKFSRELCAGTATVVARSWERHALTAILWLFTPVAPHEAVPTVAQGIDYCISQLRARGVALPAEPAVLASEMQYALGELFIAGLAPKPGDSFAPQRSEPPPPSFRSPLYVLSDGEGSIRMGWLGPDVLWARCERHVSATLAASYARRLEQLLSQRSRVAYFIDASALESYDLLARGATTRVLLENRGRFSSILALNWSGGVSPVSQEAVASFGGSLRVTKERREFDARLFEAEPSLRDEIAALQVVQASARAKWQGD